MASVIKKYNDNILEQIYGSSLDMPFFIDRCKKISVDFEKNFSKKPEHWFSSPGRIEILGNHTDHNHGVVLCASISLDTLACASANDDGVIRLYSSGYPMMSVTLNDLKAKGSEEGTSTALVRGVAAYYVSHGFKVGGFNAVAHSTVFRGAGVSSSASFELLIAEILNNLYNDGEVDEITKAQAAQYAESEYFGKPCGLLDQCAISFGGVSYIDFFDGKPHPERLCNIPEYSILLVNTGGDHTSLTDQYAAIRSEMFGVAKLFDGKTLRDVEYDRFKDALPELRKKVSGRSILRAIHFYEENERVKEGVKAIECGDGEKLADIINRSGESSLCLLQNCYPEGDKKQYIPSAVEIIKRFDGVKAARVHGGGFAGTIIAFVQKEYVPQVTKQLERMVSKNDYFLVDVRKIGAAKIDDNVIKEIL